MKSNGKKGLRVQKGLSRREFLTRSGTVGLSLASAGILGRPSMAAAAAAPAVAKPVKIVFWYWQDTPAMGKFFRDHMARFNARQKTVQVEGEAQPSTSAAREKIITAAAAGGGGPDVSFAGTQFMFEYYHAGIIRSLQEYYAKWPDKDDMIPTAMVGCKWYKDGNPFLMAPFGNNISLHYYRKDYFKEAGAQPPSTFEELLKVSRLLNKPPTRYGLGLRAADFAGFSMCVCPYLATEGVTFTDGKGSSDLDGPVAVETLRKIAQLYWDGVVQPSAPQDRFPQMVALFQAGKVAQWSAEITHYHMMRGEKHEFEDKIGICPNPKGRARQVSSLAIWGAVMMKACKEPDAAWEWLAYIMEPDVSAESNLVFTYTPVRYSVAKRPEFQNSELQRVASDLKTAWTLLPTWHKNWNQMLNVTVPPLWHQVLQKQTPVETLAKEMASLMRVVS